MSLKVIEKLVVFEFFEIVVVVGHLTSLVVVVVALKSQPKKKMTFFHLNRERFVYSLCIFWGQFLQCLYAQLLTSRSWKCKKLLELTAFFALLGSARIKAARKMLVKLTFAFLFKSDFDINLKCTHLQKRILIFFLWFVCSLFRVRGFQKSRN